MLASESCETRVSKRENVQFEIVVLESLAFPRVVPVLRSNSLNNLGDSLQALSTVGGLNRSLIDGLLDEIFTSVGIEGSPCSG